MRADLHGQLDAAERSQGCTMFAPGRAAMVNAAVNQARQQGFAVLLAKGVPAERHRELSLASQLVKPVLPLFDKHELEHLFAGALPGVALQRVVLRLAERTPLLVAVREAQWTDDASLTWLTALSTRIRRLPVAMLISVGPGEVPDALARLRARSHELCSPELTAAEERVAGLAAAGMNNREIAQSLGVLRRTVEIHLTNAYRKLDIAGRADLATALRQSSATR